MPRIKYYDTKSGTWKYADKVINGGSGSSYNVQFVEQNLTDEQKNQARNNIGAASEEEVSEIVEEVLGSGTGNLLRSTDVINNLTSTSTDKPLSANQGKVLKESLNSTSQQIADQISDLQTDLQSDLQEIYQAIENINPNPNYSYGAEELIPGVSQLEEGRLYFVYE